MTIGGITGPTRVNGARMRQNGKAGGARSGEQAGLGSTIGRTGWMINWIKRRVNSVTTLLAEEGITTRLLNAISNGTDLDTLVKQGFGVVDFIEALGLLGTIDYLFRNVDNVQDILNSQGISNPAIISAGATDTGNSGYDFSDFSIKRLLLQNDRVRITQIALVLITMTSDYLVSGTVAELSSSAQLKAGKEIYDLYNELSDYQKNNAEDLATAIDPNYAGNLSNGNFGFILSLIR